MPSLQHVLSYENPVLVSYFAAKHGLSQSDAEKLFVDLKCWLWVCANRSADAYPVRIFQEFAIIDEYWHTFLIFTKEYQRFCDKYFGYYVHHNPGGNIGGVAQAAAADKGAFLEINLGYLKESMEEVARILGPGILTRWYRDIPQKFGDFAKGTTGVTR